MQYKKKLTDIFMRKQSSTKKQSQQTQKPKQKQYDESYFQAQLIYDQYHTTLIKATATIKKGQNENQLIPLKCKWYIKNQFDFKQVQQVKTQCFQPCLNDVGNIICVQIQPQIQGMIYTGITIMKQTQQLKMDKRLQTMSNQYFQARHLQMQGKIQVMYSQNPQYQNYQYPADVIITLRENKVLFAHKSTKQLINQYEVNEFFPQIQFNRKSYNSIIFNCNEYQSMKLSLTNNFHRDLFSLIVRSIPSRLKNQQKNEQIQDLEIVSPIKSQKDIEKKSEDHTKYILKIDQLNKQIKHIKRSNDQLTANYHSERNAKIILQNQIQRIKTQLQKVNVEHNQCKPLHIKIKKMSEQNKFYFNQISIIKNQLKQKNGQIKELKKQIENLKKFKETKESEIVKMIEEPKQKIKQLQNMLTKSKSFNEQFQRQNQTLKQKIIELENSNNVLKKKVTSIVSQKSLPGSPVKTSQNASSMQQIILIDKNKQLKNLKMQITNLQMLLKHKAGQRGGQMIGMQHLVNSLTEKIAQKQLEIQTLKKINKQLCKKIEAQQA